MLWWLVDNALIVYLVLGVLALVLALRFRATRQVKWLVGIGAAAAVAALVAILSLVIVTDRKRLVQMVEEVEAHINAKNFDAAFDLFAEEVELNMSGESGKLPRSLLKFAARMEMKRFDIPAIRVWNIEVEEVDRPKATVSFYLAPSNESGYAVGKADCVLVGEKDWRVKKLKLDLPGKWKVPFPRLRP